ncbi:MAG: ABC transporter substrate-binding protein, partial [Chloroflexota bacterium]|nr:ABC transporter substrate-binding protein [Chloroflexota bacterium]
MKLRTTKLLIPALAVAMLAAACGGAAPASSPAAAPGSAQPAPARASSAAPSNAAAKAPASSAPAAAAPAGPLKIGVVLPATGPLSINGNDNQDAMNLYLASKGGKLAGREIQLVYADDAGQPDTGLTKVTQLVDVNKVSLLMGLQSSGVCYAVAGYIRQKEIPAIAMADCAAQDLTTNPKYASPYLVRTISPVATSADLAADYLYYAGFRKAIVMTDDFVVGIQYSDLFCSAFIARGGTIVQEMHPPLGTNDFGPYLSQLKPEADVMVLFVTGTDGLRLAQQYPTYVNRKLQLFDMSGQTSNGPKRNQLGAAANGLIAQSQYMEALDTPANQEFLKFWYQKYPGKLPSQENAYGWSGMQFLEAALQKVHGDVSDKQKFLNALYTTRVETARGTLKLDEHHDAVADDYIYELETSGGKIVEKPIKTYSGMTQFWDRTPEQIAKFPLGK